METIINRSAYTNNTKDVNYDLKSTKELVKLACKVIVFDINFNMFVPTKPEPPVNKILSFIKFLFLKSSYILTIY